MNCPVTLEDVVSFEYREMDENEKMTFGGAEEGSLISVQNDFTVVKKTDGTYDVVFVDMDNLEFFEWLIKEDGEIITIISPYN